MSIEMIGKQIASMRKEKGFKQEDLANYVGVSVQAVSKWENGGIPDTELLPKIADFFSVPIDTLFNRSITDYSTLKTALIEKVNSTPKDRRFKQVFDYCWDMERALMVDIDSIGKDGIEDYEKTLDENEQRYSSVMTDRGFTRMGIANCLQYFLIVPETKDTDAAYFRGIDYPAFFKDFSDADVFHACVLLYKKEAEKSFTPHLLEKSMGITLEKSMEVLDVLSKYNLIRSTQIEIDGETQTVYHFSPTPSFLALLIFAHEMIETPNRFSYYSENRNEPYFK